VSNALGEGTSHHASWRLPAEDFENLIITHLVEVLSDRRRLTDKLQSRQDVSAFTSLGNRTKELTRELSGDDFSRKRMAIEAVIKRIDLSPTSIRFTLNRSSLLGTKPHGGKEQALTISFPMKLRRRGVEQKLVIESGSVPVGQRDPKLCHLVAQAHVWFDQLAKGKYSTVRAIAQANKTPECDVSRTLRLAFLAPDIVTAIVEGRQPVELTAETFRRLSTLPTSWDAQRKLLGFSA
jgi:site-specific DNA recombinase